MVLLVVLGMFLDWVGILLLAVPIFIPIVEALEFPGLFGLPGVEGSDVVLWFGVLFVLSVYFFPSGIVGQFRIWAARRRLRVSESAQERTTAPAN
jgi:uncharacterized RDD family membrane protein YckC